MAEDEPQLPKQLCARTKKECGVSGRIAVMIVGNLQTQRSGTANPWARVQGVASRLI